MNNSEKIIIASSILVIMFAGGIAFNKLFQTPAKTMKIYREALADYNGGDFSNAYFLFSKVSYASDLKPAALYRQAEAARAIGDNESALKKYQTLFKRFPKHQLSMRAKYLSAQILVNQNPKLAKKYFEEILEKAPQTDYAIASEYYIGLILLKSYTKDESIIFPLSVKEDIENSFRHYLKQAPAGRLARNVIENWLSIDKAVASDDYLLMANSLYKFGEYPRVKEFLDNVTPAERWVLEARNFNAMGHKQEALKVLEKGLNEYVGYIPEEELITAIDLYFMLTSNSKFKTAISLKAKLPSKGHDYVSILKCDYSDTKDKLQCYKDYYLAYQNGKYTEKALAEIFLGAIRANELDNAKKIGEDYLSRYSNGENASKVMFWLGKIAEKKHDYKEYMGIYKKVITTYPDSYYAYRSYLGLTHKHGTIITDYMKVKPVEFPYALKHSLTKKLVELHDYDVLNEILGSDDFVRSWILYNQGDYPTSMLVARNAMEELTEKPDKYDLRWRLVYPILYYNDIEKYAKESGNNPPLMLALTREESYFNPTVVSGVGARGLMQIMPTTAAEVAHRHNIGFYELFNPTTNIRLGNYYYSDIKSMLSGLDVSAIASYNGGIGSVKRWKTSLYYRDTDEFIEQIPYEETQNYVKKVFRSYWNYIRIYNGNE